MASETVPTASVTQDPIQIAREELVSAFNLQGEERKVNLATVLVKNYKIDLDDELLSFLDALNLAVGDILAPPLSGNEKLNPLDAYKREHQENVSLHKLLEQNQREIENIKKSTEQEMNRRLNNSKREYEKKELEFQNQLRIKETQFEKEKKEALKDLNTRLNVEHQKALEEKQKEFNRKYEELKAMSANNGSVSPASNSISMEEMQQLQMTISQDYEASAALLRQRLKDYEAKLKSKEEQLKALKEQYEKEVNSLKEVYRIVEQRINRKKP